MRKQDDLIAYVFDGRPHRLSAEMRRWMQTSPRFTAFVEIYRDKIRKKVRVNQERESSLDVRGELEMAWRLLSDRRLEVVYEPYASAKTRGPDFAVTYRSNQVFNMEVTRLRAEPGEASVQRFEERILRSLLAKLGQMHSGMPNLLVIQVDEHLARSVDLSRLMQGIKTRADKKDPAFYTAIRYNSPSAFYKDFMHLSGVLLWSPAPQTWANPQARPGLEDNLLRLIAGLASGDLE